MKKSPDGFSATRTLAWGSVPRGKWSLVTDLPIFAAGLALFYAFIWLARYWAGPFTPSVEISRSASALPLYAAYSLLRIGVAYLLSLIFTLVYGYVAAYNPKAERVMIPLLDILQSIPVLSFLPGVMLAMVSLFPRHQIGVEFGAILLIFTGQVWNMVFSFYSSLKSIPRDLREAARLYRFGRWQRFIQMELPYAAIGLVWNSMMSVAGGWFFLMACEMFVLGSRDFRLPGLGSYLQTASSEGDTQAIVLGLVAMVAVIVILDQLVWRPLIAWAQKFKLEQVEASEEPHSRVLDFLRSSHTLSLLSRRITRPLSERIALHFARPESPSAIADERTSARKWALRVVLLLGAIGILVAVVDAFRLLSGLAGGDV
ncbi:MAG TPA: ABC transporter permease subunit, partial [Terriglobales bacterium]|nr:ABC transporter permease subunit [Terriglobales bacterium]